MNPDSKQLDISQETDITTGRVVDIIEPRPKVRGLGLQEVWQYRELLFGLVKRDITEIRNQTALAWLWRILQPIFVLLMYVVIFGKVAKIKVSGDVPYYMILFAGLMAWNFFVALLNGAANSISQNAHFYSKVYFPRLIMPLVSVVNASVDVVLTFCVLVLVILGAGFDIPWTVIFAPLFAVWALMLGIGIGFILAAINVMYRDVNSALPFVIQYLFFFSPVVYPVELVPERFQFVYSLNPLVGITNGFRWSMLGHGHPPNFVDLVGLLVTIILFVFGVWLFKRMERVFADVM